jgi:transcriptional regulator with XRE-family HTH domain
LAVDTGVDRSYIGRIERGVENPTVETLDWFAAALEVAADELLLASQRPFEKGARRSDDCDREARRRR